ncbi:MAG TPA: histidine phosphatase family protein [Nevskiaceae bacterium]|nr:histidine phosphatase family protein [Nevskiaceae bacterium]
MRLLSLVRHAKSSWDYAELSDFERPLNERGRRDAPLMAKLCLIEWGKPERLVSSPALRAITTARTFAEVFGIAGEEIIVQPKIYEAAVETLLRLVRALDDGDRHVMLFGHNPGISALAHELARCHFDEMPTCAVAGFELAVKCWSDVGAGCGKLVRYSTPKGSRD